MLFAAVACSVESDVSRSVGARCESHDNCDMTCLRDADFPGGFCTIGCDTDGDCPGGAVCVDRDQGVCLFACTAPDDCAFLGIEWVCKSVDARPTGEVSACIGD